MIGSKSQGSVLSGNKPQMLSELARLVSSERALTKPWELVSVIEIPKRGRCRGPRENRANFLGLRRRGRLKRGLVPTWGGSKPGEVASTPSPVGGIVTDKSHCAEGFPSPR